VQCRGYPGFVAEGDCTKGRGRGGGRKHWGVVASTSTVLDDEREKISEGVSWEKAQKRSRQDYQKTAKENTKKKSKREFSRKGVTGGRRGEGFKGRSITPAGKEDPADLPGKRSGKVRKGGGIEGVSSMILGKTSILLLERSPNLGGGGSKPGDNVPVSTDTYTVRKWGIERERCLRRGCSGRKQNRIWWKLQKETS